MAFKISNIYKSLVRHVEKTRASIIETGVSPDIEYHSWDGRDDEAELPEKDLIGLSGWTFREDRGLWVVHCGVTVSTVNDANLFRENSIIDVIHDLWGEQENVPLYNDQGGMVSDLIIEQFEILPAGQSEKRNYRSVGLSLLRASNFG